MSKLALAVKASLPLIAVTTTDTVNFPEILAHIVKQTPIKNKVPRIWSPGTQQKIEPESVYFWLCPKGFTQRLPLEGLYAQAVAAESSIIIVNVNQMEPIFFDCGEMDVPKDMLADALYSIVEDEKQVDALSRSLGGCTLKEAVELSRLTMADTQALTPDGVMATRKNFFQPSRGFTQIDTQQLFYEPTQELSTWIEDEGKYFLTGQDVRLRARGLLMDGVPGTGKTSGAKFIAHKFGVPLFRLDIAAAKNKYVGESESNLLAALARLDKEEPACVLVDEVDKIFGPTLGTDGGTSAGMLSSMLWWLQEHQSRILTVMTTNKLKVIPPELHRPGRIDMRITTAGLRHNDAILFAKRLLLTFKEWPQAPTPEDFNDIVKRSYQNATIPDTSPKEVPHAEVTEQVHKFVKYKITVGNGLSKLFLSKKEKKP